MTAKSKAYATREAVQEAADAHTRLSAFYSVISILEGGNMPGGSADAGVQRIITICKNAAGQQLRLYDNAVMKAIKLAEPKGK